MTTVTLTGLDKHQVQGYIAHLADLRKNTLPDDSIEATSLDGTIKLLMQIERELAKSNEAVH